MGKQRKLGLWLIIIVSLFFLFSEVKADMFQKPSMTMTVSGVQEPYYFDLLIYRDGEPRILDDSEVEERIGNFYYREDYPEFLNGYQDEDGYVSYQLYNSMPSNIELDYDGSYAKIFTIGYFSPPSRFKIMIYLESGVLLTSDITNRRLFDSAMTYELRGVDFSYSQAGVGVVEEAIPALKLSAEFVVRIVLTVMIEIAVLMLFGYKMKQSFKLVAFVNLATQTLLTFATIFGYYFFGQLAGAIIILVIGEVFVFTVEIIAYSIWLRERKQKTAFLYGLSANLLSLMFSLMLIIIAHL